MRGSDIEALRRTYDAVARFYELNGYMPTLRELARMLGLRSPSTARLRLMLLREIGSVDYVERKPRTIYLLRRP